VTHPMEKRSTVWVADTTPNMAVHRACAEERELEAGGITITEEQLIGSYVCYICNGAIDGREGRVH
jgi:hypothetical protein